MTFKTLSKLCVVKTVADVRDLRKIGLTMADISRTVGYGETNIAVRIRRLHLDEPLSIPLAFTIEAAIWRAGLMQTWLRYLSLRDGPENVPDIDPTLTRSTRYSRTNNNLPH